MPKKRRKDGTEKDMKVAPVENKGEVEGKLYGGTWQM